MTRRSVATFAAGALLLAAAFLVANRGAYKSYFQDDDLDNLSWTSRSEAADFALGLLSFRQYEANFRPAGHLYYFLVWKVAGLDFPLYVAAIQAIHLVNLLLLWLLLQRLAIPLPARITALLLFAFHPALFSAWWRPMYVFDLLCGTFVLGCLLAYLHDRWIVALASMWLAYKSKELAVMLPVALAAYEWLLGGRRWLRLLPFAAVSLCFGLQGVLRSSGRGEDYALKFTAGALATTLGFYAPQLLGFRWGWTALPAIALLVRDRRAYFGLVTLAALLLPLLILPGRLFTVYLYAPMIGAAIAVGVALTHVPRPVAIVTSLLWVGWTYGQMREYRRAELTAAADNRAYVEELQRVSTTLPNIRRFVYEGERETLHRWGIRGALELLYKEKIELVNYEDFDPTTAAESPIALLSWDESSRKLQVATRGVREEAHIRMGPADPVWQLLEGWYSRSGDFRWSKPRAVARLWRPADARRFELTVNFGPAQISDLRTIDISLSIDGRGEGRRTVRMAGLCTVEWELTPRDAGPVEVVFEVTPAYRPQSDPRVLGMATVSFGFQVRN